MNQQNHVFPQIAMLSIEDLRNLFAEIANDVPPRATEPPPPPTEQRELLTSHELAQKLNCSYQTIFNWQSKGKIPFFKIGRILRFDLQKVLEAINESK